MLAEDIGYNIHPEHKVQKGLESTFDDVGGKNAGTNSTLYFSTSHNRWVLEAPDVYWEANLTAHRYAFPDKLCFSGHPRTLFLVVRRILIMFLYAFSCIL